MVARAFEQAALLRAGKLSAFDIVHVAEEIEDVGKSEQREFAGRMAVLLARLLKWQYQADRRGSSWRRRIEVQRERIELHLKKTPSLAPMLVDPEWIMNMWADARQTASQETEIGFAIFPDACPWSLQQALSQTFYPD